MSRTRAPKRLGFWSSGPGGQSAPRGVHELYMFQRGDRAYVTASVPFSEELSKGAAGKGDFRLVDVTDPRRPVQVSDWAAGRDGGMSIGSEVFAHSATANKAGTVAIVSYWDAGAIYLDITDPKAPKYIGRTVYPAGADGDTHSVALAGNEGLMLTADEDFDPANGTWGFLRLWNVTNPKAPKQLGRFATANSLDRTPPDDGEYTVHNPFVRGQLAYLSWYSDGVRVIDIANPAAPRELGYYVPRDVRDPYGVFPTKAMVWGVHAYSDYMVASDMNAGLYVLRYKPPATAGSQARSLWKVWR